MAEGKKSFVLYCDFIDVFNELSDKDAGQLIKHIFDYVNDKNPVTKNPIVKVSFIPIKNQLKRDLKEWEGTRHERSEAGKKGMASRWHNKTKQDITKDNTVIPPITKITDTVNVTVNDTVTDNVIKNISHSLKPDENFLLELPEMKIQSAIEYLNITKNVNVGRAVINSLWTVFKQKFFTGQKFYKSESDIFTHFFETLKFEKINGHKSTGHSVKTTGAYELVEKVRTITGGKAST